MLPGLTCLNNFKTFDTIPRDKVMIYFIKKSFEASDSIFAGAAKDNFKITYLRLMLRTI